MLDENLPTFYLRSSADNVKHNASILLSHLGSDALPEYSLRHPDPALPSSRNRYAVALYDSYNPEILFGEVLLIPEWSQNKATGEEVRLNGGIPPPPQPVLPTEFIVQLYNPDQQVIVRWNTGTWTSAGYWEFEMPQQSFRQPSTSMLDRTQSDPTASDNIPKLGFKWKKEGKLSKDYVCSLSDKSTNPDGSKRKNREPDITVALFRHFKEITVYEPNLSRVELEDPKGFEVVLLLGAIVIREVFNSNMREAFNITDLSPRTSTSSSAPPQSPRKDSRYQSASPPAKSQPSASPPVESRPPPTDPRTQWELDAEAARLKKQVEREQAEQRRADAAETKRVKRMLEEEQRKERERQKEIDRETERLKKIYGKEERKSFQQLQQQQQQNRPPAQPSRHSMHLLPSMGQNQPVSGYPPAPVQRPHSAMGAPYIAHNLRPQQAGPMHLAAPVSYGLPPQMSGEHFGNYSSASGPTLPPQQQQQQPAPKKSFWRLRGGSEDNTSTRLQKQRSTVF